MVGLTNAIDWRLIHAFVAVMEEGTLSAAARRVGATQPTLGRQIRELESISGEVLFVRRGLRLEPTPHAIALLPEAQDIERGIAALGRKFLHEGDGAQREKITLTAPTLLADEMLPIVIPALRVALPATRFNVMPSDMLEDIHRRRVDIALRLIKPTQPDLIVQKLGQIEVGLYTSEAYVSIYGMPKSPSDLMDHELILPENYKDIEMKQFGISIAGAQVVALSNDLRSRLAMMRSGLGISTCHDWIGRRDPSLQRVLPEIMIASFDVWLVATDDIHRSRALRTAWDILADNIPRQLVSSR